MRVAPTSNEAWSSHKNKLPNNLFILSEHPEESLALEPERQEITVVRVPENQLLLFIGDARESFKEHFSSGSVR